jgi:hypothetical protein
MPTRISRYPHTKVYRPTGTRYAEAAQDHVLLKNEGRVRTLPYVIQIALKDAITAFWKEFDEMPDPDRIVVEVVSDAIEVKVTVLEIPDDD